MAHTPTPAIARARQFGRAAEGSAKNAVALALGYKAQDVKSGLG